MASEAQDAEPAGRRLFRAFATYATDPDAALVREVEGFLETLDRNRLVPEDLRQAIPLCVDGSDFRMPAATGDDEEPVRELVAEYLRRSDYLIAFVGPDSRDHPWVRWEVEWWLEHRGAETLLVALTGGADPRADPRTLFPPVIVESGAHRRLWFDLRGFWYQGGRGVWRRGLRALRRPGVHPRRRKSAPRPVRSRPFDRELVRLAAFLTDPELSANELIAHYDQAAEKARRRARWKRAGYVALLVLAASVAAGLLVQSLERRLALNASQLAALSQSSREDDPARIAFAAGAVSLVPSAEHRETLARALQGWLPHLTRLERATDRPVGAVEVLERSGIVASGGFEGMIYFHDLATGRLLASVPAQPRIECLVAHPGERVLLACTRRGLFLIDVSEVRDGGAPEVVATLFGGEAFFAAALTPDGSFVAGSMDGRLVVLPPRPLPGAAWEPLVEATIGDETNPAPGISGLGYASGGRRLVISLLKGEVRAYAADDLGVPVWSRPHPVTVFGLATSVSGAAAFIDRSGDVLLIDPEDGAILQQTPVAVSPDQYAATADGALILDRRRRDARTAVGFSPDGALVAVGSFDGSVELLDARTLGLVGRVRQADFARQATFTADGETLIVCGDDGAVDLYAIDADVERARLSGVDVFDASPDGDWIAALGEQGQLWIVEPDGGAVTRAAGRAGGDARRTFKDVRVTASGDHVVAAVSASVELARWKVDRGGGPPTAGRVDSLMHRNVSGDVHVVHLIERRAGGPEIVSVTRHGADAVYVWHTETASVRLVGEHDDAIAALATGRDLIGVGDFGGRASFYSIASGAEIDAVSLPAPIETVAVGPGDEVLFASDAAGTVAVCYRDGTAGPSRRKIPEGSRPIATSGGLLTCHLREGGPRVLSARFGAGGWMVGATEAGAFLTGEENRWSSVPLSRDGPVRSHAFSPDGAHVATGGEDGRLSIWHVESGALLATLHHPNAIENISFLVGRPELVATLDGDTLRIWGWSLRDLIAEACSRWAEHHDVVVPPGILPMPSRSQICAPVDA